MEQAFLPVQSGSVHNRPVFLPESGVLFFTPGEVDTPEKEKEDFFAPYIFGPKNQFSLAVIKEVAFLKGHAYNPLLIQGNTGTGKTMLMEAASQTLARVLKQPVCFMDAFAFGRVFSSAALQEEKEAAYDFFVSLPALLIDNIQILQEYPHAQNMLVQLIDQAMPRRKPLLFSCLETADITCFEAPFFSRLSMGVMVTLAEPDIDTRLRYCQEFAQKSHIPLKKELCLQIARRCVQLRHIQGLIHKIIAYRNLTGLLPDEADLDILLRSENPKASLSMETILLVTAQYFHLQPKDILSEKRDPALTKARQYAMYLCRLLLKEPYQTIGTFFGNKDHSTVMYSVKKLENERARNKDTNNLITMFTTRCEEYIKTATRAPFS